VVWQYPATPLSPHRGLAAGGGVPSPGGHDDSLTDVGGGGGGDFGAGCGGSTHLGQRFPVYSMKEAKRRFSNPRYRAASPSSVGAVEASLIKNEAIRAFRTAPF